MRLLTISATTRFYLSLAGLFLNLVAAVLIFLAFSFRTSVLNLYTVPSDILFTIINTNHLKLALLGLILVVTSSLLSILSMTYPSSGNHDQKETKTAKQR